MMHVGAAMKTISVTLILSVLSFMTAQALAATKPPPTTGPKDGEETLLDGEIIFTPPEGWQEITREGNKSIQYNSPDHRCTLMITATPQQVNLNKEVADKMGMMIKKKVAEHVKSTGAEFVISPRVEKDDLLFLKVHDRFKQGNAVVDRYQLYQMVSLDLITVISIANTDIEDEMNAFAKTANDTLLSARFQKLDPKTGQRVPVKPKPPTTLPKNYWKAQVRILGPTGWKEEMKDAARGEVATYSDPQHADVNIRVFAEPIPAGVSEEDPRLEKMADDMIDQQEQLAKKAGREVQGEAEALDDAAYIRKSRSRYKGKQQPTVISSRVLVAGHTLVNIVTEAPADQSPRVEKLADSWFKENVTPMGLKEIQRQERTERSTTQPRPYPESPAP
jgi:hypothetical protein